MKAIKCYFDENNGNIYLGKDVNSIFVGCVYLHDSSIEFIEDKEESSSKTIITAGLSAEDIVLLKQNGVI